MILYEKKKDRKAFFKKVAKAIGQGDDDDASEDTEKGLGGDLDLDEVLPPSGGHGVGNRVPSNSARKTTVRGGFLTSESIEDLEDKLCAILLEKLGNGVPSPTASPVGVRGRVPTLGHSNPNVEPDTGSGKARQEDEPYAKSRHSKKKQKKEKDKKGKEDVLDQLAAEMGIEDET